jgi:hypothetical protein
MCMCLWVRARQKLALVLVVMGTSLVLVAPASAMVSTITIFKPLEFETWLVAVKDACAYFEIEFLRHPDLLIAHLCRSTEVSCI